MAKIELKTTIDYADALMHGWKPYDIREKSKGIKPGDVIRYIPWYKGKEMKMHPITSKRYRVAYIDHNDPRVMKDYSIFTLEEIIPQWE